MKMIALLLALVCASADATEYAIPGATVAGQSGDSCASGYICLPDTTPYTFNIGSLSYPPNWLQTSAPSAKAALGILAVVMTAPPSSTTNVVSGYSIQMVNDVPTQVWASVPMTSEQLSEINAPVIAASSRSAQISQAKALLAKGQVAEAMTILLQLQGN